MEHISNNTDKSVKSQDEILNYSKDNHIGQDKNNSNPYHSTIIKLALLTKNLNSSFSVTDGEAWISKLSVEGLDTLCSRLGENCSFKRVDGFADGTYRVVIDSATIAKTNSFNHVNLNNGIKPSLNNNCSIVIYKPYEMKVDDQPKDLSMKLVQNRILEKQAVKAQTVPTAITPRSPKDSLRLRKKIIKNPRGRPKEIGIHSSSTKANLANILPKLAPATTPTSMKMILIPKKEVSNNDDIHNEIIDNNTKSIIN